MTSPAETPDQRFADRLMRRAEPEPGASASRSGAPPVRTSDGMPWRPPGSRRRPKTFEDRLLAAAGTGDAGRFLVDGPHEH